MASGDVPPPYGWAAAASVGLFGLYVLTLAPTTAFWDASEYIATSHILGIPHPPGNPLFVAVARTWSLLLSPLPLSVAVRVNLLAAVTGAVSFGFFFLVAWRVLLPLLGGRGRSVVGAAVAVLVGGTTYTVWSQSNVNEKVYTVSLLVIAAVSWLAIRWYDRREEPGSLRLLLLAGYLMAVGSTNHLMSVLPLPALAVLVLRARPGILIRKNLWMAGVPLVALGLSFSFFVPIRSAQEPVINEGGVTCEGVADAAAAIYSLGRAGCPELAANLSREQYQKPPLSERQAPLSSQLLHWFQYFDWQWARGADPAPVPGNERIPFTVLFGALAVTGLWAVSRTHGPAAVYLATLAGVLTVALVWYLNFEYGYSLAPGVEDPGLHEVRERDYFFIAGFALLGVLAGVGLSALWGALARQVSWAAASPVLALALLPLAFNWAWADRSGEYAARDWAHDLLVSLEPYAVLFTNGDNDTFPLWYLQEVEGIRKDVTVVVGQYLYTDWYPRQLQALSRPCPGPAAREEAATATTIVCQRPFDPSALGTVPAFMDQALPPSGPILDVEPEVMDRVAGGYLEQDTTVALGAYALGYPAGTYLGRGDRLALRIIQDSLGDRPIYFASSAGILRDISLDSWGVRHGLATKLELRQVGVEELDGVVRLPPEAGGEWYHVPRSRMLADEVYLHRSMVDREIWRDLSTAGIPVHYYIFYYQLAETVRDADPQAAARYRELSEGFLTTARGGRVVVGERGRVGAGS